MHEGPDITLVCSMVEFKRWSKCPSCRPSGQDRLSQEPGSDGG
jgi:hypothetical protein